MSPGTPPFEIRTLRGITYAELDARQRQVAARVLEGGPGALLLSELRSVITLGRRAMPANELLASPAWLEAQGIGVYEADRGGLATYHGPGQWVLFVVDRLDRLTGGDTRGVRKAVEALLAVGREVSLGYDSAAAIREGAEAGVWTPRGKVGAVGVQVHQGVLLHGLSLNGYRTSQSFQGLRPCGLDAPVGFLLKEGASEADFVELGTRLLDSAQRRFPC